MKTEVARCAAQIRKILKAKNIKASVISEIFAGGNSVTVSIKEGVENDILLKLRSELSIYKVGRFHGLSDTYDYDNCRPDIPQTMYLIIENERKY